MELVRWKGIRPPNSSEACYEVSSGADLFAVPIHAYASDCCRADTYTRSTQAALDPLVALLQDGSTVQQMERSGLWLVRVRWSRTGLLKSTDQQPTVDKSIARDTPFIASGRRHESDNYLFLNRADAESFKECTTKT
jgi:hypothetical protein